MKQDAKVVAIHTKVATNFFVIAVFKETRLQQVPVSFRKLRQDRAYQGAIFTALHQFFQAQLLIHNISAIQRIMLIAESIRRLSERTCLQTACT